MHSNTRKYTLTHVYTCTHHLSVHTDAVLPGASSTSIDQRLPSSHVSGRASLGFQFPNVGVSPHSSTFFGRSVNARVPRNGCSQRYRKLLHTSLTRCITTTSEYMHWQHIEPPVALTSCRIQVQLELHFKISLC